MHQWLVVYLACGDYLFKYVWFNITSKYNKIQYFLQQIAYHIMVNDVSSILVYEK